MSEALPKAYEPAQVEAYWCKFWEDHKTFTPDPQHPGEPYSIVIPPPNVTGALHMGHAFNLTIQDMLCRHARQLGKKVLWIPGTDHAGIATQNVVERALAKEGKSRHDLGREAFVERVWQWREEYGHRILNQIRRLGASVDWTRERFTMDEQLARAVRKAFVDLFNNGLIYKDKYIINWCVRCHTALADDEVEHSPRKGKLWHVRYLLEDGSGSITIATTRPETILGDSAVCVHPEDERYAELVGKTVLVPLVNRAVPIIADAYVDREFGSGALKVTPCHDPNDWNLGKTHGLEFIQVIDDNGMMSAEAAGFAGLSREQCRTRLVQALADAGQLVKEEDLEHSVGSCYRCHTVVEPYVSTQWFVAATKMAPAARAAVPDQTRMFPESWLKTYYNWLDNIRDWCISRQIWWGHRIPAWTCTSCSKIIVVEHDPASCPQCGCTELVQDPDVLDTWFSSALWPFSTMGWPDNTEDLKTFYPTSVLSTGFDIIFFWVARMMMMGLHFMKEVPFHHVYLHALVRDAEGKKMSKSSGNVIDPLEMIDKYGTDALRFTLASFAAMGRDIRMSEDRIEGYRHFINKLWNAARFGLMNLPEHVPARVDLSALGQASLHHTWILHRLECLKQETLLGMEAYRFNDVAQGLYKFLWNEFCDWYLELIKADMREEGPQKDQAQYVLYVVLQELLALLHPMIPFVTSQIWQALPGLSQSDLAMQPYPVARPECQRPQEADNMAFIQEVISAIRTIRAELNINPSYKLTVLLRPESPEQANLLQSGQAWLTSMARLEQLDVDAAAHAPKASASHVIRNAEVIVHLEGAVDFAAELARLEKELGKITKECATLSAKLANASFRDRAPQHIVAQEEERASTLAASRDKLSALKRRFEQIL